MIRLQADYSTDMLCYNIFLCTQLYFVLLIKLVQLTISLNKEFTQKNNGSMVNSNGSALTVQH